MFGSIWITLKTDLVRDRTNISLRFDMTSYPVRLIRNLIKTRSPVGTTREKQSDRAGLVV